MTAEIKIGDKPVMMCGNAATPIRYKQVFGQDLMNTFGKMTKTSFDADVLKQAAYIMHLQATGADFRAVTFDAFVEWISQFEEDDYLKKVGEIMDLWLRSNKTTVKSRKN